ncbi:unnamed protein product [Eruca vesicaria subsp. sativa]|uniref:F-box domain-containing protein n=1 Tax=Eruca vesicaria subsp. sativa TaxID=29727 RepID=A0ABC8LKF7_ERUVS|nr:unnamed protein product [Eruca vesicaria subsp. sativa]
METEETRRRSIIPDEIVVEMIARLPLRSIARFKSVCKQWRSLIQESSYLRSRFISLHRHSSSSCWSLLFPMQYRSPITEAIGFHACKTWDLPKSLASYLITSFQPYPNPILDYYYYVDSSHGLVWIEVFIGLDQYKSFVGNLFTQERVHIPPPPHHATFPTGLVTRLDANNGVVSSFKLIRTCYDDRKERTTHVWRRVYVYSSETGTWAFKRLWSSFPLWLYDFNNCLNLNGMLYAWENRLYNGGTAPEVLVSHDFYADHDQCRVIPLPVPYTKHGRGCLTTSCGHVVYVEILDRRLKVWKLYHNYSNKSSKLWQLTREEVNMPSSLAFDVDCFPLGVNPFDADFVYLWSRQHRCVVSGNLSTQEFTLHKDSETWSDGEGCWRINTSVSSRYMDDSRDTPRVFTLSQFVLPQWMDRVPRPPN